MVLEFNWLAIVIAGVVSYFLGILWFGPLFGKRYMKESKAKKDMPKWTMYVYLLVTLVIAFVLSNLLAMTSSATIGSALFLGFLIWLGFFATARIGKVLWSGKSWGYYFMHIIYDLLNLLIMSAIIFYLV